MCETLLPGPEIEPVSLALAVLSLNHWTVSEVSMYMLTSGWKSPFWSLTPMLQIQIYSLSFLSRALHLRGANPSRLHLQLSNCLPSVVAFTSIFRTDPLPMALAVHADRLNLLNHSRSYLMNSYLYSSTLATGTAFCHSFLTTSAFTFVTNHILLQS